MAKQNGKVQTPTAPQPTPDLRTLKLTVLRLQNANLEAWKGVMSAGTPMIASSPTRTVVDIRRTDEAYIEELEMLQAALETEGTWLATEAAQTNELKAALALNQLARNIVLAPLIKAEKAQITGSGRFGSVKQLDTGFRLLRDIPVDVADEVIDFLDNLGEANYFLDGRQGRDARKPRPCVRTRPWIQLGPVNTQVYGYSSSNTMGGYVEELENHPLRSVTLWVNPNAKRDGNQPITVEVEGVRKYELEFPWRRYTVHIAPVWQPKGGEQIVPQGRLHFHQRGHIWVEWYDHASHEAAGTYEYELRKAVEQYGKYMARREDVSRIAPALVEGEEEETEKVVPPDPIRHYRCTKCGHQVESARALRKVNRDEVCQCGEKGVFTEVPPEPSAELVTA
ncbi:MAG: hypothetical protein A3A61_00490 [Candidatus Woykebacteria bacterium RIFCSPLOWO2_01_FULL_43_14]|nr:MAG: hypothetical protein A3A61_00490 [Candidatus Woykebacteria bacterium RIFCSPLOWO2_01_FULL_43_14]